MINKKNGFSLAEVLIALTIAAIIATLGFTIAKKGIARAYDGYIYNGYDAISQAMSDAQILNGKLTNCANLNPNNCQYTNRIIDVLSGRRTSYSAGTGTLRFSTPNGITYRIYRHGTRPGNANEEPIVTEYRIAMDVPSAKTNQRTTRRVCMSYQIGSVYEGVLIPFYDENDNKCRSAISPNIQDIATRMDLLAFYLEDGNRGRTINGNYNPRRFRNARESMCKLYGTVVGSDGNDGSQNLIDCTGLNNVQWEAWENLDGLSIMYVNPKQT